MRQNLECAQEHDLIRLSIEELRKWDPTMDKRFFMRTFTALSLKHYYFRRHNGLGWDEAIVKLVKLHLLDQCKQYNDPNVMYKLKLSDNFVWGHGINYTWNSAKLEKEIKSTENKLIAKWIFFGAISDREPNRVAFPPGY